MGTDRFSFLLNKVETHKVGGEEAAFAKKRLLYFCFFTIITKILRESLIFDLIETIKITTNYILIWIGNI